MDETDREAKRQAAALWEADRAGLVVAHPLIGRLAFALDLVPVCDDRVPTACTDGRSVFADARFLLALTPSERRFVLAHEVWHCALGHFQRRGGRDPLRWNVAIDHETNALLVEEGFAAPADCVLFDERRGRSAEEVYEELLGGEDHDRGRLADLHEPPGPLLVRPCRVDPDFRPCPLGHEDWPGRLAAAASAHAAAGGRLPGAVSLALGLLPPSRLDWTSMLRAFARSAATRERAWHRPDRRHAGRGVLLPGRAQRRTRLAVAVDVSGSCLDHVEAFFSEARGAARASGASSLRLLAFDTAIRLDAEHPAGTPLDPRRLAFPGGGGTDFVPLLETLAGGLPPDGLVVLTDGFGFREPRRPPYPVLWVLTPDGSPPAAWARSTRMPPPSAARRGSHRAHAS